MRLTTLAVAALTGCVTTVPVRTAANADPEQRQDDVEPLIENVAAQPRAYARVTNPAPPLRPLAAPYRIAGHQPGWLTLSDQTSTANVPLAQIASVSTYDRTRGAVEGAVPAGLFAFGVVFAITEFLFPRLCAADAPCDDSIGHALKAGAVFGVAAALIGGAVGAAIGHETRYQLVSGGQ